jgi:prepilin-type processing-associated H-X9-DG protein
VVIAIIAILAAILFPVFAKAREAARQTTCINNQKQIVVALQMFAEDHDGKYPCAWFNERDVAFGPGSPAQWKAMIWDRLKTKGAFICPTDPDGAQKDVVLVDQKQLDSPASYRLNNTLVKRDADGAPAIPMEQSDIKSASEMILICESKPFAGLEWNQVAAYATTPEGVAAQISPSQVKEAQSPVPMLRHKEGSVFGFADGHARWMKWETTWKPSNNLTGPNLWNGMDKPAS